MYYKKNQGKRLFRKFDIVKARSPFIGETKSKVRPVIIIKYHNGRILTANVTTKYKSKPIIVRLDTLYPIMFWHQAGLRRKSYIDTHFYRWIPVYNVYKKIGRLKDVDRFSWYQFGKQHIECYKSPKRRIFWKNYVAPLIRQ